MTSDNDLNLNQSSRVKRRPDADPDPGITVDPRLRQRWVETRRQEGRRRLRVLLGVVSVGALAGGGWAALRSPLLDVDRVVVEGAVHSGPRLVRQASAVRPGGALLDLDESAIERRVAALPWVLRAEVRRDWPGTVRIRITERLAAAVTRAEGDSWAVLDRSARVLGVVATPPPDLARIEGLPQAGAPGTRVGAGAADALGVVTALPPALAPRVAAVAVGGDGLTLRLVPHGEVRLGGMEAVEDKLRSALTVLGVVDGRTVATLDVRIPAAPVLTRR